MASGLDETITLNAPGARPPVGFGGWLAVLWTFVCLMAVWHFTSVIGDGRALETMFESRENAAIMRGVLWVKVWVWGPFLMLAPLGHRLTRASAIVAVLVVTLGEGYAVIHLLEMDMFKALAVNAFNTITAVLVCLYLGFSRRIASYRESQRRADARARRHFTLFLLVIGGVSIVVFAVPAENTIDRVSILTAWQFMWLLAVVLLIGPLRLLRTGRVRANMYLRRDLGIWAGITGLMHLFAGTGESMTPAYVVEYVNYAGGEGGERLREQLFTWSTIVGLVIGVLVLLLVMLSNDAAIRRLGVRWWKGLHRTSYAVFALTAGHAFAFQVLESRESWLMVTTGALVCVVVAIQFAGIIVQRRRRRRRRKRRSAGTR